MARFDIESFFSTITTSMVKATLLEASVDSSIAGYLALLVTVDGVLPEGFCTSPAISNLAVRGMDDRLSEVAQNVGAVYTRYADDMTFSVANDGASVPSEECIDAIISDFGFRLSPAKTRISVPGQQHFVTGLSVERSDSPSTPKRLRRRIRQELHYVEKFGLNEHAERAGYDLVGHAVNKIDGRLNYVSYIHQGYWSNERKRWRKLIAKAGVHPNYPQASQRQPQHVQIFIDEANVTVRGVEYLAVAAVEFSDPQSNLLHAGDSGESVTLARQQLVDLTSDYILDHGSAGRTKHLLRSGLHHTADHHNLREQVAQQMAKFPMLVYLGFVEKSKHYKSDYFAAVASVLHGRLLARRRDRVDIVFEINPEVPQHEARDFVEDLRMSRGASDLAVQVYVKKKQEEPLLATADYSLGVFFAQTLSEDQHNNGAIDAGNARFLRLRPKYRYITNATKQLRFNKKNPLRAYDDAFPVSES